MRRSGQLLGSYVTYIRIEIYITRGALRNEQMTQQIAVVTIPTQRFQILGPILYRIELSRKGRKSSLAGDQSEPLLIAATIMQALFEALVSIAWYARSM